MDPINKMPQKAISLIGIAVCFFRLAPRSLGPFFLGRHNVTRISRFLEKLETRGIAYSNQEKKCGAYKENFLRRWSQSRVLRRRAIFLKKP